MIIPPPKLVNLWKVWTDRQPDDPALRVWATALGAWNPSWPAGAVVLEIGCADTHWLTFAYQYDPTIRGVGIDWRNPQPGPGTRLKADVLTVDLPLASFDAIVMLSTIEHIGLGNYEHDPLDPDGDTHTMARCVEWLKPGGWVYADVPYNPDGYRVVGKKHRIYDDEAIETRLTVPGLELGRAVATTLQGDLIDRPAKGAILPAAGTSSTPP
jgi:SAM-dependent methyltransferase